MVPKSELDVHCCASDKHTTECLDGDGPKRFTSQAEAATIDFAYLPDTPPLGIYFSVGHMF